MNNVRTNSPSFGMALFAPTQKKVAKVLGQEAAVEFEKVRPALEKIAKDAILLKISDFFHRQVSL